MNAAAIDPDRLRRALHLTAKPLPSGDWTVGDYHVHNLRGCCCPDARIRGAVCKHLLATRLHPLDPELREALKEALT